MGAPRLNGIRYFEKPVLGYWAIAISQKVFGDNAWAIRLPSALAIGFSALCMVLISRRCQLPRGAGWYAGLACLTMLGMVITGTTSLLDGMFTGGLAGALTFFYMAWTAKTRPSRVGWLVLFGGFCGLSFLIKGFLGLAVPVMVIAPFLIWMGKWRDFFLMPWIPMLVAAIVIALGLGCAHGRFAVLALLLLGRAHPSFHRWRGSPASRALLVLHTNCTGCDTAMDVCAAAGHRGSDSKAQAGRAVDSIRDLLVLHTNRFLLDFLGQAAYLHHPLRACGSVAHLGGGSAAF